MYRYITYVEIFVTVNCRTGRDDGHHSKPKKQIKDVTRFIRIEGEKLERCPIGFSYKDALEKQNTTLQWERKKGKEEEKHCIVNTRAATKDRDP
ncbi:hypothetical protein YC2023_002634 [Brassica napus]